LLAGLANRTLTEYNTGVEPAIDVVHALLRRNYLEARGAPTYRGMMAFADFISSQAQLMHKWPMFNPVYLRRSGAQDCIWVKVMEGFASVGVFLSGTNSVAQHQAAQFARDADGRGGSEDHVAWETMMQRRSLIGFNANASFGASASAGVTLDIDTGS
jgi:hypothetical protein